MTGDKEKDACRRCNLGAKIDEVVQTINEMKICRELNLIEDSLSDVMKILLRLVPTLEEWAWPMVQPGSKVTDLAFRSDPTEATCLFEQTLDLYRVADTNVANILSEDQFKTLKSQTILLMVMLDQDDEAVPLILDCEPSAS